MQTTRDHQCSRNRCAASYSIDTEAKGGDQAAAYHAIVLTAVAGRRRDDADIMGREL